MRADNAPRVSGFRSGVGSCWIANITVPFRWLKIPAACYNKMHQINLNKVLRATCDNFLSFCINFVSLYDWRYGNWQPYLTCHKLRFSEFIAWHVTLLNKTQSLSCKKLIIISIPETVLQLILIHHHFQYSEQQQQSFVVLQYWKVHTPSHTQEMI